MQTSFNKSLHCHKLLVRMQITRVLKACHCLLRKLLFRYYLMIFKCALAIWLCSLTAEVCDVPCTGEVELIVKTGDCLTFFGIHQVAKNFKFAMLTL